MFKNMTVKLKLTVLTIIATLGFIITIVFAQNAIHKMHELGLSNGLVNHLDVQLLELSKLEEDFVREKDEKNIKIFDQRIQKVIEIDHEIERISKEQGINLTNLTLFFKEVKEYESAFKELIKLQREIGMTPKDGLYNSLSASLKKVKSESQKTMDYNIIARLFDMKKFTESFESNKDLQYVKKFNTTIDKLISKNASKKIATPLKEYKNAFKLLVEAHTKMGLSQNDGLLGKVGLVSNKMLNTMHDMEKEMEKEMHRITEEITFMNLIIALITMFVIILFIYMISKQISNAISNFQNGLKEFFDYINKKSTTVHNINSDAKDEFGIMADMVNENIKETEKSITEDRETIDETIKVLTEFEQGNLSKRVNVNTSNESLKELTNLLNQMATKMEENINSVLNILGQYAKYDYTKSASEDNIKEHFLKLVQGVNNLGKSTTEMLIDNKSNGLTLDISSDTLLVNVDILNTNSNQAAAALEETSAALEEMTSSISSNTENVIKMSGFANKLSTSANEGQTLANETTSSMDEINDQVSSISEAIKVIDQISFQTNILSLNAAVEAATAGEAGKGFAVVAQEVRNLAARSAEAANEIKSIVENATQKASNGKKIADKMIEGYTGLSNNISETLELITNVEAASKEQQTGIIQINDAITSLDKQTQENASVASQTQSIAAQTDEIAKMIVADADEKEFIGKNTVKAQKDSSLNIKTSASKKEKVKTSASKEEKVKKTIPTKVKASKKEPVVKAVIKNTITPVVSDNSDDEWASF